MKTIVWLPLHLWVLTFLCIYSLPLAVANWFSGGGLPGAHTRAAISPAQLASSA